MNTPLFSIVIPIYKVREDYLNACVESITNQSFRDIEIILVDDGSPDNCGELCDSFAERDDRIRVIHKENGGVSAARNTGIEAASGQWIVFADGDDWHEEGAFEKIAAHIENCDCDMLMFRHTRAYENKNVVMDCELQDNATYDLSDAKIKEKLYRIAMRPPKKNMAGVYFSWDKAFRREFLTENELRYPVGLPKSEDKVFILYCLEKCRRFCFINEPLYFYRINANSVCNSYSENADKDRLNLADILMPVSRRMDRELEGLLGETDRTVIYEDCRRFLFGIISDVFMLKFFHKDCPYDKKTSRRQAKKFIRTEPFRSCIRDIKYSSLSASAKLKKFLLGHGAVGFYFCLYRLEQKQKNKKAAR